jgi:hypothetical protein
VSIAIGVFDLFTYATPGALYISLLAYVSDRFGWLDIISLAEGPSIVFLVALLVASYIMGQVTYSVGSYTDRLLPAARRWLAEPAVDRFLKERQGAALDRHFYRLDIQLLLAAVETSNREAAAEVSRLRAVGLMLRNSAPPLLIGSLIGIIEAFTSSRTYFAITTALALLLLALGSTRQGLRLRIWANAKTYELAYWVKGIDSDVDGVAAAPPSPESR